MLLESLADSGLLEKDAKFWKRSLHALGYDHVPWWHQHCIQFSRDPLYLKLYNEPLHFLSQAVCTKPWDHRVSDLVDNFLQQGIVHKIAHSSEEDLTQSALVAM